ncbi:MAG: RluA family pseudouridine synthase [Pseudomonadota bacterium]
MKNAGSGTRLVVSPAQGGERLDRVVVDMEGVGSRRRAREAIATGKLTVDGRVASAEEAGQPVAAGAVLELDWARPGTGRAKHQAREGLETSGLKVIFEDPFVLVLDKPAGLLTDTATKRQSMDRDSLRARVQRYLKAQGDHGFIVHRLDRDTSGVVLVARTSAAEADLRRQFRGHRPERVYHAVLSGVPRPLSGRWADWMAWDATHNIQRQTPPEAEGAVLAEADYRVLDRFGDFASLVEVRLHTGRRNQIRLHATLRGHPLLGEVLYLPEGHKPPVRPQIKRQALHAAALGFLHPVERKPVRFEAPYPDDLRQLLEVLARRHGRVEG